MKPSLLNPKLIPTPHLGSPAAIYHDNCEEVLIDPAIWYGLNPGEQGFILEHEKAHCRYDTKNEFKADRIGAINHLKQGGSPRDILSAMELTHHPKRIKRMKRFLNQDKHAGFSRFGPTPEELLLEGSANDLEKAREASQGRGFQVDDEFILDIIEILGDTAGGIWGREPLPNTQPPRQDNSSTLFLIGGIAIAMFIIILIVVKK